MVFLSALFLLSAMLVTQAKDISDDLDVEPLSEILYVFDVTSDAPVEDLKKAVKSMTLRHSFRVAAEKRYIFVALGSTVEELLQVNFPEGSMVTQYPVEHICDFFKMFGVTTGYDEDDKEDMLDNKVLTMSSFTFHIPETTPTAVYKEEMAEYVERYTRLHADIETVGYAAVGYYPPRIMYVALVEPNAFQRVIGHGLDNVGGPGSVTVEMKHVIRI